MQTPVFDNAAHWVFLRQKSDMSSVSEVEIAQTVQALYAIASKGRVITMIPDLFPGVALEVLYVPTGEASPTQEVASAAFFANDSQITAPALRVIGDALVTEFERHGDDMARYEFDDGAEAIAYLPDSRNTVLQAMNLVLLTE